MSAAPPSRLPPSLFPARRRSFPYRRSIRLALRSLHLLSGGVLLGGVIFDQSWELLRIWWLLMALSGLLLFLTDLYATLAIAFQVSGVAVLLKIVLVAAIGLAPAYALHLLTAALLIGSITSHMPGNLRHRYVLLGPLMPAEPERTQRRSH